MKYIKIFSVFLIPALFICAQSDLSECNKSFGAGFIPYDRNYSMEIKQGETANFQFTFYDGFIFRVKVCSNISGGNLVFALYDSEGNVLFSNKDYEYTSYWDFVFKSTIECTIKAEIIGKDYSKATIQLAVGYKGI